MDGTIVSDIRGAVQRNWTLARTRLTPRTRRDAILAQLPHGEVAPGGIESMSLHQIREKFGNTTVKNHLLDRRSKNRPSYNPNAYEVLKSVRALNEAGRQVAFCLTSLATPDVPAPPALLAAWKAFPDERSFTELQTLRQQTAKHIEDVQAAAGPDDKRAVGVGNKARQLIDVLGTSADRDWTVVKWLSAHEQESPSPLKRIFDVESRFRQTEPRRNAPDDHAQWSLDNLKAHAQLGVFSVSDLLKIAISEETSAKSWAGDIAKAVKQNATQKGAAYYPFYSEFGKNVGAFISATLGQTVLAHDISKPINDWTVSDFRSLTDFAKSRYSTVHSVVKQIADKALNPLGGNLDGDQLTAFTHETLRSSLYPNYNIQLRVGIGGTTETDPLIRSAAYILTALDVMTAFHSANAEKRAQNLPGIALPSLVIVDGSQLGAHVNGLDSAAARQNGSRFLHFLQQFASEFYPAVSPAVSLLRPKHDDLFDKLVFPRLLNAASNLVDSGNPALSPALTALQRQADGHASGDGSDALQKAITYAAAHCAPGIFGTVATEACCTPVLKIGGAAERSFNQFQTAIAGELFDDPETPVEIRFPHGVGSSHTPMYMTTQVGDAPPPYYRSPESSAECGLQESKNRIASGAGFPVPTGKDGPARDTQALAKHPRVGWDQFTQFLARCAL